MNVSGTDDATLETDAGVAAQPVPGNGIGGLFRWVVAATVNVWSTTGFDEPRLTEYAGDMMLEETRKGLMLMAVFSLLMQVGAVALYDKLHIHSSFVYTYSLLAVLSFHIVLSARWVNDLSALHMLGTTLLVITGVAIMAVAHRGGALDTWLLASIVLLFMVMPLMPWGLRESAIVIGLTYAMFTLSSISGSSRFEVETLWMAQFLMVAAAATAAMTIARNTAIRKADIKIRYELEDAHHELALTSARDALTGAWNRRYLQQNFDDIAQTARAEGADLHLAVLDVDSFKSINDTYGHQFGDTVLRRLVQTIVDALPGTAHVLRIGGDEFAVLDTSENFEAAMRRGLRHFETDPRLLEVTEAPVTASVGFATVAPEERAELDLLYRTADRGLYADKDQRRRSSLTGRWRIEPLLDALADAEHPAP